VRKDKFLSSIKIENEKKLNEKTFSMKLTLLPHQIFILPESYNSLINKKNFAAFKIYTNEELR
jgi:hypothetical protein